MRARFISLLALALLAVVSVAHAATGGFISTLSSEQQSAAGLTHLSADQQLTINTLVAREVSLARQGNVRAFAGTFSSRRKPEEKASAGLDQLSPAELTQLDQLVAAAIAAGPSKPELPSRLKDSDVANKDRLQVHGTVSVAYGWGGGREMRAASLYTTITDPDSGFTLGLGISQYSGDGWWCYDPFDTSYYYRPGSYWTGNPHYRSYRSH